MHEPDLFLASNPYVNAFTFGVDRPFVVLQSGLVDLLTEEELMGVMGHELGTRQSRPVLYRSLVLLLLQISNAIVPIPGLAQMALRIALFDWYRKSELTADAPNSW